VEMENPIRAAKKVTEADERQLPSEMVVKAEKILGLIFPAATPFSKPLESLVNRRKQQNRDLLFQTVLEELEKLLDREQTFSDEHQRWVRDEFPGLLVEGLHRAEETRSRQRIVRLAKVIRNAVKLGPAQPADLAAEMMRVAMDVSEQDVAALARMYNVQSGSLIHRSGRPDINEANKTWAELEKQDDFFRNGADVYSTCLKLQSLGLIMAMDRIPTTLGLQSVPFALLPKGKQFVDYIRDELGR